METGKPFLNTGGTAHFKWAVLFTIYVLFYPSSVLHNPSAAAITLSIS